mmetsp:Transcript_7967/g.7899  ORF Transcript_7967/g.7899 Transcript_7967/m.7899 type:complete len:429 (-) Transcript_7967:38-1324(-)
MSSLIPISTYNLALQPFNPVQAIDDEYPVTIRLTLAAVDPEAVDDKEEPSTLRLLKRSNLFVDDEDLDDDLLDDEAEEADELDSEEEEEIKPKNKKKQNKKKVEEEEEEDEDEEDEDEEDLDIDGSSDEEDDEDVSEFVVCTLSPKVQFQQTIDLTITPDEEVYFVVTGSYPVHLTGNYVEHPADEDSEDEYDEDSDDEYNLTPDEDEIIDGEEYDLDDLEDASDIENKIEELVEEEEAQGSKKRNAEQSEAPTSKKSKKAKKEDKKSVQFTKELEQGPTGSTLVEEKADKKGKKEKSKKEEPKKEEPKKEEASKKFPTKTLLGGVITEDRKTGKGQTAKSGNKVGIRYIGKLKNGKVFDKNTSGKPFVFGLGKGECIKGFDLGVTGMAVGGERRVVIPPKMGYGSQALPGIPANSELTFDIKLVSIK